MSRFVNKLFSLSEKTAIVTGCSRGIGAEIATAYKKAGANVVCLSRSAEPSNGDIRDCYRQCDITDREQFASICSQTIEDYGCLDILVNAAGITLPIDDSVDKYESFSSTIKVNLLATYQCIEEAAACMIDGGSIINVSSIGSFQGFPGNPGYVASKGGIHMLSKSLALDLGEQNIRVNNLVPGYIKTDMTIRSYNDPELHRERLERMIIKRWGRVEDLVGAAIFLASDASSYVTGSDLVVDGGWTAKGL
ncbi:MAG: 2-deoxy-D-gluconate 3-dehydrogenase [Rhodospirillaceae bacterium]|jgi:NAD(P)-dependent dehydrogenase (short-subunit alcohol dehydrogenase family)|nr:2-deoxy-D-gluconate 3-dehydrogenase [Rhodospirillaceae bacterium]|tara:strand:- start:2106 stop:2855 length:750 start_codon:yes stop_codon:yes gene_type:complete